MAIRNKTELLTKFATPIWITRLVNVSTLNKKLLKFFYEQKKLDPEGIKRSSIFGWHSKDYQEKEIKKNEPYRKFFNKIRPCIQQISDDMGWNKKILAMKSQVHGELLTPHLLLMLRIFIVII